MRLVSTAFEATSTTQTASLRPASSGLEKLEGNPAKITTLDPSVENARSRTMLGPGSGARQSTESWPETRSYRVTVLGSEVATSRLPTGENATRPWWG